MCDSPYKTFNSAYSVINGFNLHIFDDLPLESNRNLVNMNNYKSFLYGAVVYSVIIGIVYVVLSIIGLLVRWCIIDMRDGPLIYMFYMLYFRVSRCEPEFLWNIFAIRAETHVIFEDETEAVRRTFIFLMSYLGSHLALVLFSLYALCGVNNSCLGRKSFPIFFVPWIIVLMTIIILDVLATAYYVMDLISLSSAEGLISLLEVQNHVETMPFFNMISAHHRYLPPLFMLIATAKVFILFFVNIFWIVVIIKAGWTASTYHKYLDKTKRNYENTMASVNPAFEGLRDDVVSQKQHEKQLVYLSNQSFTNQEAQADASSSTTQQAESRYQDTSQAQAFSYPHQIPRNLDNQQRSASPQSPRTIIEEDSPYRIKRPSTLVLPQSSHQSLNSANDIDDRMSHFQENSGNVIKTVEPLKFDDVPEQQQSANRVLVLPPITEAIRLTHKPVPPPKPQVNRFSVQPSGRESPVLFRPERTNSVKTDRSSSNIRPPQELRSQLPWSYFKPRDEAPQKAFSHAEGEPVPDYYRNSTKMSSN